MAIWLGGLVLVIAYWVVSRLRSADFIDCYVVVKMAIGTIDLKYLVADEGGSASLSRFQMLLFTFVIASLYFLYALHSLTSGDSAELPSIPTSVLGLMGISGGSYLLSKGINAASGANQSGSDGTPIRKNIS